MIKFLQFVGALWLLITVVPWLLLGLGALLSGLGVL